MNLKEFIKVTNVPDVTDVNGIDCRCIRPHIICEDGYELSVQASAIHYCIPRINNQDQYESYEVMQFSECDLNEFINTVPKKYKKSVQWFIDDGEFDSENTASHVPHDVLEKFIEAHGGIKYIRHSDTRKHLTPEDYIKYILNYGK